MKDFYFQFSRLLAKQILFLSGVLVSVCCWGQPKVSDFRPDLTKYSPNTAAFMRYGDMPVNKYTGVPSINVPLYTIETLGFSMPIGLSYHAGGAKVEEESSWVGLGWSLNAGGQITRIIRGSDDFKPRGFYTTTVPYKNPNAATGFNTDSSIPLLVSNGSTSLYIMRDGSFFNIRQPNDYNYSSSAIDGEPDLFRFQAGNYSGSFIIDRPRNGSESWYIRQLDVKDNIKIEMPDPGSSFVITTPDGARYSFNVTDNQVCSTAISPYGTKLHDRTLFFDQPARQSVTTWYLSSITLPNTKVISFTYQSETLVSYSRNHSVLMLAEFSSNDANPGITREYEYQPVNGSSPNLSSAWTITQNVNTQRLINSIQFGDLSLVFVSVADRVDIKSNTAQLPKRLQKVQIVNNGQLVKEFRLTQDYFDSGSGNAALYSKRLRLNQLVESDGTIELQPYVFSYCNSIDGQLANLPDNDSFDQDFWGFYNGKKNDLACGTLAPRLKEFYISLYPNYQGSHEYKFSDRTVDERYVKIGTLNAVTYPTKGQTRFSYESNDFGNVPSEITSNVAGKSNINGLPEGYGTGTPEAACPTIKGGGLRIFKIVSYDCLSDKFTERRYEYKTSDGLKSSGKLMFRFLFHMTFDDLYTCYGPPPHESVALDGHRFITRVSSASNLALGSSAQGGQIGYSRVAEYVNNNLAEENWFENTTESLYANFHFEGVPLLYYPGAYSYNPNALLFQRNYSHTGVPNIVSYSNGNEVRKMLYATTSGGTKLINDTEFVFQKSEIASVEGLLENTQQGYLGPSSQAYFYKIPVKRSYLVKSIEKSFDMNQNVLIDTTHFTYNSDYLVSSVTKVNSSGIKTKTNSFYPRDVVDNPSNFAGLDPVVYNGFVNTNFLNTLVRSESKEGNIVTQTLNVYHNQQNGINPYLIRQVGVNAEVLSELNITKYDSKGNIIEYAGNDGVTNSILYDHGKLYPIAKVVNARYDDVAYSSFEADALGNWTFNASGIQASPQLQSLTGKRYFNVSGNSISKSSVASGKNYIVSYWSQTGGCTVNGAAPNLTGETVNISGVNWTYYQHELSNPTSITVAGNVIIDELRLYPKESQMVTYTYDPFVGMTSTCDLNNRITYYEYDSFKRLAAIRDHVGNIVKQNTYNYNSNSDCKLFLSKAIINVNFTKNNCAAGWRGTSVPTTISEGTFVSLISQADADNQVTAFAQNLANQNGTCQELPKIDYIQKTGGTAITIGFTSPANATSCSIVWQDVSYHQDGNIVVPCSSPGAVTLPGVGRTYLVSIRSYYPTGFVESDAKTFTFEAFPNQQASQSFVRNNCQSGYVGGSANYVVPAGRYYSTTQAAADQLAQDDVTANGQNFANANGTCTLGSGYNVYITNNSQYHSTPNLTFTIDGVSYQVPVNYSSTPTLIGTVTPGTHSFVFPCGTASYYANTIKYNVNGTTYSCSGNTISITVGAAIYITAFN